MADPGNPRLSCANPKDEGVTYYFGHFPHKTAWNWRKKIERGASLLDPPLNRQISASMIRATATSTRLRWAIAVYHFTRWKQNSVHTSVGGSQKCGRFRRVIWTMGIGYIHYILNFVYTYCQHDRFCKRHHWFFWQTLWRTCQRVCHHWHNIKQWFGRTECDSDVTCKQTFSEFT